MVLTTIAAVPEPTQTVLPEVVVTEGWRYMVWIWMSL